MNFQNHSCLLPQRTSDIRNLEESKGLWNWRQSREGKDEEEGGGEGGYGQERHDENQI